MLILYLNVSVMTLDTPCCKKTALQTYARYSGALLSQSSIILTLAVCLFRTAAAADVPGEDIIVHVNGFTHARGQAIANLFREGDDVFGKPYVRVVANIQQNTATLVFPSLPQGSYAVTVFHDANGNNDLDHNFLRFPAEPLGFSNGFKLSLFSGMPSFEKLRFSFGSDFQPLEISAK